MIPPPGKTACLLALLGSAVAFAGPEDDRQSGDDAWNRGVNTKIPKPATPQAVAWFCPKCNHANKNMRATKCARPGCGYDYAAKPTPAKPAAPTPARPVFTPGQPTPVTPTPIHPTPIAPTPINPTPIRSWLETGAPPLAQPSVPSPRLPAKTLEEDKARAAALLDEANAAAKAPPRPVASGASAVPLLRPANPTLPAADWDRARRDQQRIDELNDAHRPLSAAEIEELHRAKARVWDFQRQAIYSGDLTAEERERLKLRLHVPPDTDAPLLPPAPPARPGLMRVVPPPPTIEPEPPGVWGEIKEDASILSSEYAQWLNGMRAKMRKKLEPRRGGGTAAVRG